MHLEFKRKLPIPQQIKTHYPLTEDLEKIRDKRAEEIRDIFSWA